MSTGCTTRLAFYVHREVQGMLGGFLTPQRTWTLDQKLAWKTYDREEAGAVARQHNAKALPVKEAAK